MDASDVNTVSPMLFASECSIQQALDMIVSYRKRGDAHYDDGCLRREVFFDIGCGDGRWILYVARRHHARGYGVDISENCIADANSQASRDHVSGLVSFSRLDFTVDALDLHDTTVVFTYLMSDAHHYIENVLERSMRGRDMIVISLVFTFKHWTPVMTSADGKLFIYDKTSLPITNDTGVL